MDSWLPAIIIIIAVVVLIGNLSTVHKNAKQPLRKKGLNDLKETLPRTNKNKHVLENSTRKAVLKSNKK